MVLSRRLLLWGAAAVALRSKLGANDQQARRFRTAEADIEMTIEFHDGYSSRGFELGDLLTDRRFCLSADGDIGRNCLSGFRGSLAIAHYRIRPRSRGLGKLALREYVRTIDRDKRLGDRPPFERAIVLEKGAGSDLQVFGYEPQPGDELMPDKHGPWYLYRQDLFLDTQTAPFLIVYWKHALTAIRVLDIIPGDQTWVVSK